MLFPLQVVLHRLNFKGEQHETLCNSLSSRVRPFRYGSGRICTVYRSASTTAAGRRTVHRRAGRHTVYGLAVARRRSKCRRVGSANDPRSDVLAFTGRFSLGGYDLPSGRRGGVCLTLAVFWGEDGDALLLYLYNPLIKFRLALTLPGQ